MWELATFGGRLLEEDFSQIFFSGNHLLQYRLCCLKKEINFLLSFAHHEKTLLQKIHNF